MTRPPRLPGCAFLALASIVLFVEGISAQTPIGGSIWDGSGGPLLSGTVYHATGSIDVPVGKTLTIQPGAIVKFGGSGLAVNGTLDAKGTSSARIVFTSLQDDSAGGDTNGNGPSVGAPDQWAGLSFGSGAGASAIEHATVAFSGVGFSPAIRSDAADLTLRHTELRDGQHGLLQLMNGARPFVEFCDFQRSGSQPSVFGANFDALPRFTSNTASGSGAGNYVRIDTAAQTSDVSVVLDDCLNGWLVLSSGIHVPAGRTLTLGAGIVLKLFNGQGVLVDGKLVTNGTQDEPVVFTSIADDVYGGDTNNNGVSTGSPDTWSGLRFNAGAGASALSNTVVRYTGLGFSAAIEIFGSSPSFSDCLFRNGQHGAIDLNGIAATPTFTRCAFQDNANYAVQIPIAAAAGFIDCVALGSTYGQFLRIVDGTLSSSLTLGAENLVNGALVLASPLVVPAGVTLTLKPGATFKSENGVGAVFHGGVAIAADGGQPVVFTRIEDDEFGGDTNSNGSSVGSTDSWHGVTFTPTATGSARGMRVRYAGLGFSAGIHLQSASLSIRNSRADACAHDGFRVSDHLGEARGWVADKCRDRGIALLGGAFDLRNATVFGTVGVGIANAGSYSGDVRDSISYGNSGADLSGIPASNVSWSLVAALAGQNGNTGGDPLFRDAVTGDLRLAFGSPCIDAGDPQNGGSGSTGADASGAPRYTDGNLDGVRRIDPGAYEYTNVDLSVSGAAFPGLSLLVATSGAAGSPTLLAIGFDGEVELPPYGTLFLNVSFPWLLLPFGTIPVAAPLPIPSTLPTPLDIAFQAIVSSGPHANLSNVEHVRITQQ